MLPRTPIANSIAVLLLALAAPIGQPSVIAVADQPKTAKERLSDKASDDQRVDNCRVPLERRGPETRPGCSEDKKLAPPEGGQGTKKGRGRR